MTDQQALVEEPVASGADTHEKTVFIYVHQGFSVRYLLRSQVLRTLNNGRNRIVILSANAKEEAFAKTFRKDGVILEPFEQEKCETFWQQSKLQKTFRDLRAFVLNGRYNTRTVDDFRAIYIGQNGWIREKGWKSWLVGLGWEAISRILKSSRLLRKTVIRLECAFYKPIYHRELFEKYRPDLVVVTALTGFKHNEYMAREARHFGVPVACVVLSWDNTSGNGYPGYEPDYVIAWTDAMKQELIQLNDVQEDKIYVGGIAHFDAYYKPDYFMPKETLFEQLGLDLERRTIFYATKSPKRFPWGPELVEEVAEAMENGMIGEPAQIVVRIHPLHYRYENGVCLFQDVLDAYTALEEKYEHVIINAPRIASSLNFDMEDSEILLTASLLKHSDLMLNMFSTMVLEAAIFDLPAINVCIREKCRADFGKSRQDIMIDYHQTHNSRVVQTGGVRTVFSSEEMYEAINSYLTRPDRDHEQISGRTFLPAFRVFLLPH